MEVEDDLFFADLSRQISLLIMDDEDPVAGCPTVSFQAFSRANYPPPASAAPPPPSPFFHEQRCRRSESKGTGVFIPQTSQPRRKNRQGRFTSFNTKSHSRQHDHKARTASQSPYNIYIHHNIHN